MDKNYIVKLKEIQRDLLLESEDIQEVNKISKGIQKALVSIDGFTNLFGDNELTNYKNIDAGIIERCWNIAKNDKKGIGQRLLDIFSEVSTAGMATFSRDGKVVRRGKDVERVNKLNKWVAFYKKENKKLKTELNDKQASWAYIKAGVIFIIIGLIIGIGNNPEIFNSATKKAISTARYVGKISVSKNNINVAARGFSHFYIRVMKFMDENQAFTMCFMAGIFLIGIGIWKRYW